MRVKFLTLLALVGATIACLGLAAPAQAVTVGDVVFIIDESGSMADSNRMNRSKASIRVIAQGIRDAADTDVRFALVAFGGAPPGQPVDEPFIVNDFSRYAGLDNALNSVDAHPGGGNENGLWATEFAMQQLERFRGGARKCVLVFSDDFITDEDYRVSPAADLAAALQALNAKNARWSGFVDVNHPNVQRDYGPNGGSLSAATGGLVTQIKSGDFEDQLANFQANCINSLGENPSAFSASTTEGRAPLRVTFRAVQPGQAPYVWRFGDGSGSATGRTVRHTYNRAGNFTARLTAGGFTARLTIHVLRDTGAGVPPPLRECTIIGGPERDQLIGSSGRDIICGLGARDDIRGRGGNDVIVGGPGPDRIYAGGGADSLFGQGRGDRLYGQGGADRMSGGGKGDILNGGGGSDVMRGNGGSDAFNAQDGRLDYLFGARGRDVADADGRDVLDSVEVVR